MAPPQLAIGIDFGTTNSSVALGVRGADGGAARVEFVPFRTPDGDPTASSRSLLYLEQNRLPAGVRIESFTGSAAIERYVNRQRNADASTNFEPRPGRLIQSLKSYLAVRNLTGTEVFGRRYSIEELIARIAADLRLATERHAGGAIPAETPVVVGRPVRFVAAQSEEDDAFAAERLRTALAAAGLNDVSFLPEPVAAAFAYEATLEAEELILIGDFGGGTSDFSLVRVGPGARSLPAGQRTLGNAGLGLAGDAFDAKLVRYLVSPALGSESVAWSFGKELPAVPAWIYANLERWHYLSFLRTRNVDEILRTARLRAREPEKVEALETLIDEDLGYQLHGAVQRTKIALSHEERAEFAFEEAGLELRTPVSRAEFEGWIRPELESIAETIDGLLARSGVSAGEIDRVFLTGGTSFVPAVRRIFEERFTRERVLVGEAFTSVAQGLALHALERAAARLP